MAQWIYKYLIKVNGSFFPVLVSDFHSGCVSIECGPPLCWSHFEISRRCWTLVWATYIFMGFASSWWVIWWGVGNRGQNNDTRKEILKLIITEGKTRVGVGLDMTKILLGFEGGVYVYHPIKKEGIYESWEIYDIVCACIWRDRDKLFRK